VITRAKKLDFKELCKRLYQILRAWLDHKQHDKPASCQGGVRNKIYDMGSECFLVAQGLD